MTLIGETLFIEFDYTGTATGRFFAPRSDGQIKRYTANNAGAIPNIPPTQSVGGALPLISYPANRTTDFPSTPSWNVSYTNSVGVLLATST